MEVGVVDMYPSSVGCWYLIQAVIELGYVPVVLHMNDIIRDKQSLSRLIGMSGIKYWIFSGSPLAVHNKSSLQIPLKVFGLKGKEFLLICYSMESVLKQLGFDVVRRLENKKEYFNLRVQKTKAIIYDKEYLFKGIQDPIRAWRNHHYYTPALRDSNVVELASYRGELMIAFYNNLLFTQFHPERSYEGRKLMRNWLEKK